MEPLTALKKTKIICTLGPASSKADVLERLIAAGMNIARLNFSHGTHAEHAQAIKLIRAAALKTGQHVGILGDIQGPKIRTGCFAQEPLFLKEQEHIFISVDPAKERAPNYIYVDYPELIRDVAVGGQILLADGMFSLTVVKIANNELECVINNSGELSAKKGISLPGVSVSLPALTDKDCDDLQFAVQEQIDMIAVSFARKPEHLLEIRGWLNQLGGDQLLISKIENEEGFQNSEAILQVCDGIMVARGDLGVEYPPEDVPLIQRRLIELCNNAGKPVIIATEMLESMIRNPRPTRAEVTDVSQAILDGTDAIMLSAETAVGKYPVNAVAIMHRIALRTEATLKYETILASKKVGPFPSVGDAISHATCQTALDLKATVIITSTQLGSTARMVSKYRPQAPVIATTTSVRVAQQLTLAWGVYPVIVPPAKNIDEMFDVATEAAKKTDIVKPGDLAVITAGVRTGIPGSTNLLQVLNID